MKPSDAEILVGFIGLWVTIAFAVLGYQVVLWLQDAVWRAYPVSDFWLWLGWRMPDWPQARGVQKIAEWMLSLPLSVGVLAFGGILTFMLVGLANDAPKQRKNS